MTECHDATTEQGRPDEAAPDKLVPNGPAVSEGDERQELESAIATWRSELGDEGSVSASLVQDRLLDLWGLLPEGEIRSEVETWLVETLQRHLYQVAEIERRLDSVLA